MLQKVGVAQVRAPQVFVVAGFPRSGTSVASALLHALGVYFGEQSELRGADAHNRGGYFEHRKVSRIVLALLRQARNPERSLFKARGLFSLIGRARARFAMAKLVGRFNRHAAWGFKAVPARLLRASFYFWRPYLPNKPKIVAIYRHPIYTACSYKHVKGHEYLFAGLIREWTHFHESLFYYMSRYESILLKYEDLLDVRTRPALLDRLQVFVGRGNRSALEGIVNPSLSASEGVSEQLKYFYPLPARTREIFQALDRFYDAQSKGAIL